MYADRELNFSSTDPVAHDPPVWHAFRPEAHSSDLRWIDLKQLADRRLLGPNDYVWYPSWDSWRPAGDVRGLFQPPEALKSERVQAATTQPKNLKDRAWHEFQAYMMITVYIWSIISLLRLHQMLLADTYNFTYESQGRAIVIALVLGKVVLIAEALRLGDVIGNRLPALSIAIRAILFAAAILAFHACEEVAIGLWGGEKFDVIVGDLSAQTVRRSGLLAVIMTIALVPYFLIKEIEKRTGQSHLLLLAVGLKR